MSASLRKVDIEPKTSAPYAQFNDVPLQELQTLAKQLHGKRILHLNSTEKGGGVAELLQSQVALEQGLGLKSSWYALEPADNRFFEVTKKLHNLLHGATDELSPDEQALYEMESQRLHEALTQLLKQHPADIIVCHDPQPLAAVMQTKTTAQKIFRLHVDLSNTAQTTSAWLCEQLSMFQAVIVSREDLVIPCLATSATAVIPPAIDPLTKKNTPLPYATAATLLATHGIPLNQPIVAQVSRFDVFKDQRGVIAAYKKAKETIPKLTLILVGFIEAKDDPEAAAYLKQVVADAASDPDIHLFSDPAQLRGITSADLVNAIQSASDIIIQKSIKEGFGLTVTEAMWKKRAVIGTRTGGVALQITDGRTGRLVNSIDETAAAIVQLFKDPVQRHQLGEAAHQSVQQNYLISRFVYRNLQVYQSVVEGEK